MYPGKPSDMHSRVSSHARKPSDMSSLQKPTKKQNVDYFIEDLLSPAQLSSVQASVNELTPRMKEKLTVIISHMKAGSDILLIGELGVGSSTLIRKLAKVLYEATPSAQESLRRSPQMNHKLRTTASTLTLTLGESSPIHSGSFTPASFTLASLVDQGGYLSHPMRTTGSVYNLRKVISGSNFLGTLQCNLEFPVETFLAISGSKIVSNAKSWKDVQRVLLTVLNMLRSRTAQGMCILFIDDVDVFQVLNSSAHLFFSDAPQPRPKTKAMPSPQHTPPVPFDRHQYPNGSFSSPLSPASFQMYQSTTASATSSSINLIGFLADVSNLGYVRIIAATTPVLCRKYLEGDLFFNRNFRVMRINEPIIHETYLLLHSLRSKFETEFGVIIDSKAIRKTCELSVKVISHRFNPEKSIDILRSACVLACEKVRGDSFVSAKHLSDIRLWESVPVTPDIVVELVAIWTGLSPHRLL